MPDNFPAKFATEEEFRAHIEECAFEEWKEQNDLPQFERLSADDPDNVWEWIEVPEMRTRLKGYYKDVDACIALMKEGGQVRTPFAFYRIVNTGNAG